MGMSSGGGGGRAPMADINITPMVDVMLVLLIIFIVAAPMLSETGLEVDLPDTRAPEMPVEEEKLILTIQKTEEGSEEPHKIFLGETQIPNDRVDEALSTNTRLASEGEVYIKADEMIPYGVVVRVFAAVRRAGIEKVGLVTDPAGTE